MPFRDRESRREWERRCRENTEAKRLYRREYERERKNAKRVAQYLLLPEPERSRRLEANARRRGLGLRWRVER